MQQSKNWDRLKMKKINFITGIIDDPEKDTMRDGLLVRSLNGPVDCRCQTTRVPVFDFAPNSNYRWCVPKKAADDCKSHQIPATHMGDCSEFLLLALSWLTSAFVGMQKAKQWVSSLSNTMNK